jgi:hyperosmotically inducible protein
MYQGHLVVALTLGCLLYGSSVVSAMPDDKADKNKADAQSAQPDNTKKNKRDRNKNEVTADQQKENPSDRELTQKIRKSIMEDKSLSTYAHNVKIISQNGAVTLKGPVRSEEEEKAILAKATEIAGATNVKNEMSVKPDAKEGTRAREKK